MAALDRPRPRTLAHASCDYRLPLVTSVTRAAIATRERDRDPELLRPLTQFAPQIEIA
jgi:hypothetical protein